jgi:uncharacterized protein (TIGR02996 family)
MTTEDDFQKVLDDNPDDWQTRLVFADWLQERNDPRAEGYRALGLRMICPYRYTGNQDWGYDDYTTIPSAAADVLPGDWFALLGYPPDATDWACGVAAARSRSSLENAAAEAFSRLSAERRALFSTTPPCRWRTLTDE